MSKIEFAHEMKKKLLNLEGQIAALKSIEVGINGIHFDKNSDIVLTTTFSSYDDLASYAIHPEHIKVGEFIKGMVTSRACVDFEY